MITEKAMLAAVHISVWTATKHDREASREIAHEHGADERVGRYNKKLLQQAEKLEAIRTLACQTRAYFYKITLPWSDEGYRILPANLYFELAQKMAEFEQAFHTAVNGFLAEYPSYIEQVRPALNGLFRPEDYPSAAKIREKFELRLEILPIRAETTFGWRCRKNSAHAFHATSIARFGKVSSAPHRISGFAFATWWSTWWSV